MVQYRSICGTYKSSFMEIYMINTVLILHAIFYNSLEEATKIHINVSLNYLPIFRHREECQNKGKELRLVGTTLQ